MTREVVAMPNRETLRMQSMRLAALTLLAGGLICVQIGCGGGTTATPTATPGPTPNPTPTPTPTPAPVTLDDLHYDATIKSTCSDPSQNAQVVVLAPSGEKRPIHPRCFPSYFEDFRDLGEGHHTAEGRPLPIMGRTCGPFKILVVFEDNAENRALLEANKDIPPATMQLIKDGKIQEGLQALLDNYTAWDIVGGMLPSAWASRWLPFSFRFEVVVTTRAPGDFPPYATYVGWVSAPGGPNGFPWGAALYQPVDVGQRFPSYDAVLLLHELGQAAGWGVKHWPAEHPFFYRGPETSHVLHISPESLQPGLLGNELLRRNIVLILWQYTIGPSTTEVRNGITYDVTPFYNPRTGENIEPLVRANEGKTALYSYYSGYTDIDADGVLDCVDHSITPTADNVDGDLVPDRFDPDLNANNSAFIWRPAP